MTMMTTKPISTFLVVLLCLAGLGYWIAMSSTGPGILLVQFAPMLAAFVTLWIKQRNLRGLGWGIGKWRYQALAWVLPFMIALITFWLTWTFEFATFAPDAFLAEARTNITAMFGWIPSSDIGMFLLVILLNGTLGLFIAFGAVGEELGWRGFLAPALMRHMRFATASVVLGVIWSIYHFPLLIWIAAPKLGIAVWPLLLSSMLGGIALTFIMNWLRISSGSVWTAVLFHAALNIHIQGFFAQVTKSTSPTSHYIANEYGYMIAAVATVVAIACCALGRSTIKQTKSLYPNERQNERQET